MDSATPHPLTPEEAKAKLRAAAQNVSMTNWMSRRRWRLILISLAGGFIAGRLRIPIISSARIMQQIVPALLTMFWLKRKK